MVSFIYSLGFCGSGISSGTKNIGFLGPPKHIGLHQLSHWHLSRNRKPYCQTGEAPYAFCLTVRCCRVFRVLSNFAGIWGACSLRVFSPILSPCLASMNAVLVHPPHAGGQDMLDDPVELGLQSPLFREQNRTHQIPVGYGFVDGTPCASGFLFLGGGNSGWGSFVGAFGIAPSRRHVQRVFS